MYSIQKSDVKINREINQYILDQLEKLNDYFTKVPNIKISVFKVREQIKIKCYVISAQCKVIAEAIDKDIFKSINIVINKIEKQIQKFKTKNKRNRHKPNHLLEEYMKYGDYEEFIHHYHCYFGFEDEEEEKEAFEELKFLLANYDTYFFVRK
jgi:ribosomal subunit interface protein